MLQAFPASIISDAFAAMANPDSNMEIDNSIPTTEDAEGEEGYAAAEEVDEDLGNTEPLL
jgi:hypothetical protein